MPRTRQVITNQSRGNWQAALAEAARQLRSQANMGRTQGHVSQEAIWNRALQIGGRPPTGAGTTRRQVRIAGQPATAAAPANPLQTLIDQFQQQNDAANAANEARYNEILTGYRGLIGDVTSGYRAREDQFAQTLAGYGDSARADVNRRFDQLGSAQQSDLVSRGLTGTTIRPAVQSANEEARARALSDLGESITGMRLSGQSQLSGDTLQALAALTQNQFGFQERRTDQGPNFSMLANLAQLFGAGNQGQGFGVPLPTAPGIGGTVGVRAPAFNVGGFQPSNLGAQLVGGAVGLGMVPWLQSMIGRPQQQVQPNAGAGMHIPLGPNWFAQGIAEDRHRQVAGNPTYMPGGRGRRLGPGTAVAGRYPASVFNNRHYG